MEDAEGGLGDQRAPVEAHSAEGLGGPGGVAGEDVVILGGAQLAVHPQVEDIVIDELLGGLLGEDAGGQVALDIDVQEGGGTAEAHRRAILLLDGGQVAEVGGLDGLAGGDGRLGDIQPVHLGQLLQAAEVVNLAPDILAQADGLVIHHRVGGGANLVKVLLLLLDQAVDTVERHAAIVADNAPAAVGIRQPGEHVGRTQRAHLLGVGAEDAVVVRGAIGELGLELLAQMIAVGLGGLLGHPHPAKGIDRPLQRRVRLQADNQLVLLIQVAGLVVEEAGGVVGIDIEHAALVELLLVQALILGIHLLRALRRAHQEGGIALVRRVVGLDKVAHINGLLPCAGLECGVLEHRVSSELSVGILALATSAARQAKKVRTV